MKSETRIPWIIGGVCLILGVVLGALLGSWTESRRIDERVATAVEAEAARADRLEAELSQLRERSELEGLHLRLGRLALEADDQNYGTAGEQAARLFDDAAGMAERAIGDERAQAALDPLLAARDDVTAGLATADSEATETLKQLYLDLFDRAYPGSPG